MAEPKTPPELADRIRDHRAQHRAHDGFVRETFTQPRECPPNGEGGPRSLPEGGLHERGRALA